MARIEIPSLNEIIETMSSGIKESNVDFSDCIAFPFVIPTSANPISAETVTINGDIEQSGKLANDETISNGIALTTHIHSGITKGGDKTEKPE